MAGLYNSCDRHKNGEKILHYWLVMLIDNNIAIYDFNKYCNVYMLIFVK